VRPQIIKCTHVRAPGRPHSYNVDKVLMEQIINGQGGGRGLICLPWALARSQRMARHPPSPPLRAVGHGLGSGALWVRWDARQLCLGVGESQPPTLMSVARAMSSSRDSASFSFHSRTHSWLFPRTAGTRMAARLGKLGAGGGAGCTHERTGLQRTALGGACAPRAGRHRHSGCAATHLRA